MSQQIIHPEAHRLSYEAESERQLCRDNKGLAAARYVKALFAGNGNQDLARAFAESQNWRGTPEVKALVSSISSVSSPALLGQAAVDFSGFVRPKTLLGRIKGFRHVPLRTRLITGVGGSTASWVGEGRPKPISRAAFQNFELEPLKVVGTVLATKELLRFSNPRADVTLQDDLAGAVAEAIDTSFIDPYSPAIANVRPASITYGVAPINSSGSTIKQIISDFTKMQQRLIDAGSDMENAVWVLGQSTALFLSTLYNDLGNAIFPQLSVKGGRMYDLDVYVTKDLPQDSGGATVVLFDPSAIAIGDDDGVRIDLIREGSLQMDDSPSVGAVSQVSLWQTGTVAIRVERFLNWKARRTGFVQVLNGLDF